MAGDIKISETNTWMVPGWVFENVIRDTLPYIPQHAGQRLLNEIEKGFGEGKLAFVDLSKVRRSEKTIFLRALEKAFKEREAKGSEVFNDPDFYPGYIERFRELIGIVATNLSSLEHSRQGQCEDEI
ncbi:MAG TPA: hypothetical protein VFV34_02130 [Blastocatellia bacterium]|nr:hypothetical protein [Blastocatellia bacterium]